MLSRSSLATDNAARVPLLAGLGNHVLPNNIGGNPPVRLCQARNHLHFGNELLEFGDAPCQSVNRSPMAQLHSMKSGNGIVVSRSTNAPVTESHGNQIDA